MKILCLIMCLIVFTSCSQKESTFSDLPFEKEVEFTDGELTVKGNLFFDGEKMVFSPHTPKGYVITVAKNDCQIEYNGIVFKKNLLPLSRFLPLYDMLCESKVEKDNLKITVLKE